MLGHNLPLLRSRGSFVLVRYLNNYIVLVGREMLKLTAIRQWSILPHRAGSELPIHLRKAIAQWFRQMPGYVALPIRLQRTLRRW